MAKYIEHLIAPTLLILSILISLTHYLFLTNESMEIDFNTKNLEWIFLSPAMIVLPILPLISPLTWVLLNAFGYAKLYIYTKDESDLKANRSNNGLHWGSPMDNNLGSPDSKSKMNMDFDYEDGNSLPSVNENERAFCSDKRQLLSTMKSLLFNQDENLWRSANLLQVWLIF